MYRDSPDDSIQDELDELVFENHALGRNILGTEDTVGNFSQQDFFDFIATRLDTSQIIFSVVGNISFKNALKQIELPCLPFYQNEVFIFAAAFLAILQRKKQQ